MYIKSINKDKSISVAIPLTNGTGKTRIKKRSILNEYGIPVSTKQVNLTLDCYVEWQIGYDVVVSEVEKLQNSTLQELRFVGANGKLKALYELSEYVYYFYNWGFISKKDLLELKEKLLEIEDENLLDTQNILAIKRSHLIEKVFNETKFYFSKIEYPILIHKFDKFEIITEIVIREKQYAIGVQPMLYLCFPITELKSDKVLLGRTVGTKEEATFLIDKNNYKILLKLLHLFGMLSINHRKDIFSIIDIIIEN